jgi:ABC-type multidrug transport system fused ATPase/permease subunit
MEEVKMACEMANIHEYIEGLPQGYDSMVGERGIRLSGGQRQRIAIARAILKNAPILILDEATSSLDTQTERLIQESLRRLFHNSTTTVIAIAHRLSTIKNLDRIIVLDQGKISAVGGHESLLNKSEIYRKLWQGQAV